MRKPTSGATEDGEHDVFYRVKGVAVVTRDPNVNPQAGRRVR
jgi:hypothetical protein